MPEDRCFFSVAIGTPVSVRTLQCARFAWYQTFPTNTCMTGPRPTLAAPLVTSSPEGRSRRQLAVSSSRPAPSEASTTRSASAPSPPANRTSVPSTAIAWAPLTFVRNTRVAITHAHEREVVVVVSPRGRVGHVQGIAIVDGTQFGWWSVLPEPTPSDRSEPARSAPIGSESGSLPQP